ncbi:MAG: 2-amino-4-hydroxy-6-hydroxymethyldihydropteridine diphosphokinase [Croceibacterium sp.]
MLAAALADLERAGLRVVAAASTIETDPLGPSIRRYANSAAVIETELAPPELLSLLQRTEREFGRRASGQRWRARVLDLDIVLWSGGAFASNELTIPHALFRERAFVLLPAAQVAPGWRDPLTGHTLRQLRARLTHPRAGHR